ncbi:MAG TPA: DUF29 domain-containing protein [Candidatus Binataceae bacterium]|nr:DUF29 domain-containing protein [Candidatus Binataceae bacterium]
MYSIERDFHGWLLDQAAALRARDYESLDWDHLAEEIEDMAARNKRRIEKHLRKLLLHLLKFKYEQEELHRHKSWRDSVNTAREDIEDELEQSPGIFQGKPEEVVAKAYRRARRKIIDQSGLPASTFPEACPWSYEQIMAEDFFPGVTKTD